MEPKQCDGMTLQKRPCQNQAKSGQSTCGRCVGHIRQLEQQAYQPHLSGQEIEELAASEHAAVRSKVFRQHPLSLILRKKALSDDCSNVRAAFADRQDLDDFEIEHLLSDAEAHVRQRTIYIQLYRSGESRRFMHWLPILVGDSDDLVRERTVEAFADDVSLCMVEHLVKVGNYAVRSRIAQRCAWATRVMAQLADDESHSVRRAVAGNPRTASCLLDRLSADDEGRVLSALAGNPSATTEILERLSLRPARDLKVTIAGHPLVSMEVLFRLINDSEDQKLRQAILKKTVANTSVTSEMLVTVWDEYSKHIGTTILGNVLATSRLLEECIAQAFPPYRSIVLDSLVDRLLEHPAATEEVLIALIGYLRTLPIRKSQRAKEQHIRHFCKIAASSHAASRVASELAQEGSDVIRETTVRHLYHLLPLEIQRKLCNSRSVRVKCAFLNRPDCEEKILTRHSSDENYDVRLGVAKHPKTPGNVLTMLCLDSESRIASAAAKTLSGESAMGEVSQPIL